ncbi:soluble lytic murein transglycosylase [Desulfonatronum thiosulfatophilum]|uniref:Soluble lytic murein transglycosylase n=1 Tax=Desulfonatronum thiosulfatophilum TaxID=617002 RepID=A0A1G6CAQ2_9BACT|nr:lytic transglycosylase domain-containing protein [Desulfonatronum thiosulfatophilum]SDB29945.1 soluble lytic murein transglycosylase [Desulfonatronum thiosulfatophilum]
MSILRLMICGLVALFALHLWPLHADADFRAGQRELFLQAEEALRKGQQQTFRTLLSRLEGYPLTPYLVGQDLERRLCPSLAHDVRSYLEKYGDSPVADSLRRKWLSELAKHRRWNDFLQDYTPQSNENLQCLYGQALLGAGKTEQAMEQARVMWLSGNSRPKSCDPLFEALINSKGLTRELVIERMQLAINAGQISLVRYLSRFLPAEEDKAWVAYWQSVNESPRLVLDRNWKGVENDFVIPVLTHGIRKLTRVDASRTAEEWDRLKLRNGLIGERFSAIEEDIALYMSLRFEDGALERVGSLPGDLRSDRLREWGVRAALRRLDWPQVLHMVDGLTERQKAEPRWQYWRARALEQTGWTEQALAIYETLAPESHYFGMLAADRLGRTYNVDHAPIAVTSEQMAAVRQEAGLQRAVELFALERYGPGRSEWQKALGRLDNAQAQAAARWAQEIGWHDRAITATVVARHSTDLDIRFPLPHAAAITIQSNAKNLNPAWVYGVMRQESLFMEDVGSSAGALGLMQIMPQTGKRIAGWHGEQLSDSRLLLQPDRNIRFGTTYLRRQLDDLQNHYALATAAYNAGQHRVKGWLPRENELPADAWVETIPFNETRNYVERVLCYTAIYEHRLGNSPTRLSARLAPVRPLNGSTQVAEGKEAGTPSPQ